MTTSPGKARLGASMGVVLLLMLACMALWIDVEQQQVKSFLPLDAFKLESFTSSIRAAINDATSDDSITTTTTARLPDALWPVTFDDCCGPGKDTWKKTCFTEKACNNTIFPFASAEEKALLEEWNPERQEKQQRRERCEIAMNVTSPPVTWCQESDMMNFQYFPTGCSEVFGMGGRSGPFDRLYVFPQAKLAFCGIPKAGISRWMQFLRFTFGAKDYQSDPYFKRDVSLFRFDTFKLELQMEILQNASWTKAIFIRDPAERLLSAFLDKIKGNPKQNVSVTFEEFVHFIAMPNVSLRDDKFKRVSSGLTWNTDPHWRPQAWSCGVAQLLPHFQYVGSLDRAAEHTRALLERVGLWETHGRHYRISKELKGRRSMTPPPPPLLPGEKALGFQQQEQQAKNEEDGNEGSTRVTRHERNSKSQLAEYYTPELMDKVKKLYWMDFALWDALQQAKNDNKVRGREIAAILNPKCK